MTLQSNADLRLLIGLRPVSSVFWPLFPVLILHLLISVCTQFHHWEVLHYIISVPFFSKMSASILMKRYRTVKQQMCNRQHVCQYVYRCITAKKVLPYWPEEYRTAAFIILSLSGSRAHRCNFCFCASVTKSQYYGTPNPTYSTCKTNTTKYEPQQKLQHTTNWEQDDRCGNSSTQSQATEDGYINVRNMLSA